MGRILYAIILLAAQSFASTLVQSALGGSGVSAGGLATSTAAGFASPTVNGNLLVCVVWSKYKVVPIRGVSIIAPTTSGFTWVQRSSGGGTNRNDANVYNQRAVTLWFIFNAPVMSPSDLTTAFANLTASGATEIDVEFALLEFAGLDNAASSNGVGAQNPSGISGTPTTTFTATTTGGAKVLVIAVLTSDGSALGAGSGYALAPPQAVVATNGQIQWQGGVTAGTVSAPYVGTSNCWGMSGIAFQEPTVAGVNRHRGSVF